jgi:hypothetical protein
VHGKVLFVLLKHFIFNSRVLHPRDLNFFKTFTRKLEPSLDYKPKQIDISPGVFIHQAKIPVTIREKPFHLTTVDNNRSCIREAILTLN